MGQHDPLSGCGTALITPFSTDGGIDEPALRALVDWQLAEGAPGFIILGTTGEGPALPATMRPQR